MTDQKQRRRSTRQGAALDDVLGSADGFLTAQELYDALRHSDSPIGLTTVYRHLRKLADSGNVDVLTREDGEAAFRLCGPASSREPDGHHHHVVCRVCGFTVEIAADDVESWASKVAADAGFSDVTHTVEIFGVCSRH